VNWNPARITGEDQFMKRLAIACAFVRPFALAQIVAYAQIYTDTITGFELPNSTSATGNFSGRATGQPPGSWYASVNQICARKAVDHLIRTTR
jgi:hypothetical protein